MEDQVEEEILAIGRTVAEPTDEDTMRQEAELLGLTLERAVELGLFDVELLDDPAPDEASPPPPVVKSNTIPRDDLKELFQYYERWIDRMEQPSTMGAQLEKLAFFAHRLRPCVDCGGDRKKWIGGSGFITSSKQHELLKLLEDSHTIPGDIECPTCCRPRRPDWLKPEVMSQEEWDSMPRQPGWVLGGRRARGPQTVRRTGSSKKGCGVPSTGGDESLATIGRLLRLLRLVHRIRPISTEVIGEYCSPGGRSIDCLWHLTPAGKTMLRKRNDRDLSHQQFFENERERQRRNQDTNLAVQIEKAREQSQKLWDQAGEDWNEALDKAAKGEL